MTVAVTTLRSTIAGVLDNPGVWDVYSYPPASPTASSVVISADDPYLEPTNNDYNTVGPTANFKITMMLAQYDNKAVFQNIEEFMVAVFNKLANSTLSFRVGTISAPTGTGDEMGKMIVADMSISLITTWS